MPEINPYENINYNTQRGAFGVLAMAIDIDKDNKEFFDRGELKHYTTISQIVDFQERMQNAFSTAVVKITLDAVSDNNVLSIQDNRSISLNNIIPIVFGVYVGLSISIILKQEGIPVDVKPLFIDLTRALFLLHSEDTQKKCIEIAGSNFQLIARSTSDNIVKWCQSVNQLTRMYMLTYRQQEPETRKKIGKAYSELLKGLLNAIEPA